MPPRSHRRSDHPSAAVVPFDQSTEIRKTKTRPDPRRDDLKALAARIEERTGHRARVLSPSHSGTDTITSWVGNPHAPHRDQTVGCDLLDGEWWFTWPLSGSRTRGPASDLDGAVNALDNVLKVRM